MKSDALKRLRNWRERVHDPLLTTLTILMAAMIFMVVPFHAAALIPTQIVTFVFLMVFIAGVLILSGTVWAALAMAVALSTGAVGMLLRHAHQPKIGLTLDAAAFMIVTVSLAWIVSRAVFGRGNVNYHRIIGAVLLYLTIALIFVSPYTFLGLLFPDAFSGMAVQEGPKLTSNLIYFSMVTMTSTGYGDIAPIHPVARSLANLETIIGQLYPATLLARLVSLEVEGATR
jgi:hypothetical protein